MATSLPIPVVVGLDISTSVTALCVLDVNTESVVMAVPVILSDLESFWEKVDLVESKILEVKDSLTSKGFFVQDVLIEEPLKSFQQSKSSASTLLLLSKFNGVISCLTRQIFLSKKKDPMFINVNTARKLTGIKIDKKDKSTETKEKVLSQVLSLYNPSITWDKKVLKSGPRKGLEVYESYVYDICDSYVVAKSCLRLQRTTNTLKKETKQTKVKSKK